MSEFPALFSEISLGTVRLKNRIVLPAMATNFPTEGTANEKLVAYLAERARGQAGLITTESVLVEMPPSWEYARYHLLISDDRFIPSLKALTNAIHAHDAKIAVQLHHLGRQIHTRNYGGDPVAPSPIPCPVCKGNPRELTVREIASLIDAFVQGARRACEAGFDMVELQGCHGYLISEFLSLRSNHRTDAYGGDTRGRARFLVEIIKGIKRDVDPSFPIIARINGHDYINGGATLEDMRAIAPLLVEAGADAIHVTAGVYGSYRATVSPSFDKPGCFVDLARGIREVVDVPVIAVGRINDPHLAEEILQSDDADLIAMGRALIADPELPAKAMAGKIDDICKCTACNQGCIDTLNMSMMTSSAPEEITCLVNPRVARETEGPLPAVRHVKRILVVGGGPAGCEAALTAAQRGHHVSLWERKQSLGGQFLLAGEAPGRSEFKEYISYMERQLENAGVEIRLETTATPSSISAFSPDAVVAATGATPTIPSFADENNDSITTAWNVLRGAIPTGEQIAIIGGGAVGLETAHFLSKRNKTITILEATSYLGGDMGPIGSFYLRGILKEAGIQILRLAEVITVMDNDIIFIHDGEEKRLSGLDAIVISLGAQPDNTLAHALSDRIRALHVIGDARTPRKAIDAIREGFQVGLKI